jgi:hypothetical protein
VITFDVNKMSEDEWAFIRCYCAAVARDYDLMQIIRALVAPDFHVKPFYAAVQLGQQLLALQNQTVEKLYQLGDKHGLLRPNVNETPYELIAEVFTQSFFKIVDSATKSVLVLDKTQQQHDGWSSGHPLDWQSAVHALQEIHTQKLKTKNAAESIFMTALFKLFSSFPSNMSGAVWPPTNLNAADDWSYDDDDEEDGFYDDSYYPN